MKDDDLQRVQDQVDKLAAHLLAIPLGDDHAAEEHRNPAGGKPSIRVSKLVAICDECHRPIGITINDLIQVTTAAFATELLNLKRQVGLLDAAVMKGIIDGGKRRF